VRQHNENKMTINKLNKLQIAGNLVNYSLQLGACSVSRWAWAFMLKRSRFLQAAVEVAAVGVRIRENIHVCRRQRCNRLVESEHQRLTIG